MSGEGSRLQNGGLTLLLISLPADSDDRLAEGKCNHSGRMQQGDGREFYTKQVIPLSCQAQTGHLVRLWLTPPLAILYGKKLPLATTVSCPIIHYYLQICFFILLLYTETVSCGVAVSFRSPIWVSSVSIVVSGTLFLFSHVQYCVSVYHKK